MEIEKAREFVRQHHQAVLAVRRADGQPQMSPVVAGVDGAGRVVISTRETAVKVRHLRRDPRAWLCVMKDGFYGEWVQIEGTTTILSLPEALDPLVDFYHRTVGEHPNWEEYRAAMATEKRVLLQITIERAGPDLKG